MSKKNNKRHSSIDIKAPAVGNDETLLRLLCSPQYYDEELDIVNADAFDLRMLGKNKDIPEEYVSLGRSKYLTTDEEFKEYLSFGDKIKWPEHKPQNVFSAYGKFMCSDAIEVHDMVEIHPLVKSKLYHIGLFYNKMDGSYYKGPLPKTNPDVLEVLGDLASLLEVSKV